MAEFLDYNKREYLDQIGLEIWKSILDGRALLDPERYLSRFGLLVYGDLKKYKFFYWFAFPAINYPKDVQLLPDKTVVTEQRLLPHRPILEFFDEEALAQLQEEYDKPASQRSFQRGYFVIKYFKNPKEGVKRVSILSLAQHKESAHYEKNEDYSQCTVYFAFTDPSSSKKYPGWPLRNFLSLIAVQFQLDRVKIIRLRRGQNSKCIDFIDSMIFEATYSINLLYDASQMQKLAEIPLITGWEKNESQQVAPKCVNLSSLLDPKKLAEDAVNLNLRLMKWRLLPTLDLDKIANTKCLLLGCGTLGCHISRGLLAWGIKNITIVDNAKISYSNPVRQTLYTFDDCTNSKGAYKAEAAAISLRRIHPSINVKAHILTIPMPGHHVADKEIEQTRRDVSTLEGLIEEHDVIFLLMDTRESRWLPTVIAMSKQKLTINAAIGFDTFLLQRYGIRHYSNLTSETTTTKSFTPDPAQNEPSSGPTSCLPSDTKTNYIPADKLGCYFCNDIVAPGDSTQDRTLDQQCTVSRPGVSMMVSAMAVELMVSIVSSQLGASTPAPIDVQNDDLIQDDEEKCGSELGIIPHSLRGNLARYYTYMPTSPAFNKCSACSSAVVNAYKLSGYEFLQRVFEDPSYLEEVAGLKDLQNISDNVWALDSDEDPGDLENFDS